MAATLSTARALWYAHEAMHFLYRWTLFFFAAAAALAPSAFAQTAVDFRGTVGQQPVIMTMKFDGDTITAAQYRYESQKTYIALSESRLIGSTVILADDDGNVFHLHLKGGDGNGISSLALAAAMSGQMDRDELTLPVEVHRTTAATAR